MSWLFTSGGQSIGTSASASVLPINNQGWFPLGLTSLISLQSRRLSRVFSSTTLQKHQFFSTQPSLWSNSHLYMTTGPWCWKGTEIIVVLEVAPKYYILDSSVEYEGYSISSRIFLPTVIDICSSALNLLIPVNFSSLILKVSTILHLLLDHIQFTLIHGPNIPGSYAILDRKIAIFTASDFTLATRYVSSCT